MTAPDELVRDGLRRIADQAGPVGGGGPAALADQVIAGAERRRRRMLATTVVAVVAVLVLGALTATRAVERHKVVPAGPVPFRHAVTAGPVVIGWYHLRGMKDDADWVLNPATGRYRLLRGEEIYDISRDGRTALAHPEADSFPRRVDLVDLVHGTVTALPVDHLVTDARWAPDGNKFVVTVADAPGFDVRRSGFYVGWADSRRLQYVSAPGPAGNLPQQLRWTSDDSQLWSAGDVLGLNDGGLRISRIGQDGRPDGSDGLNGPANAWTQSLPGPMFSPHDRYVLLRTADVSYRVYALDDGVDEPASRVGWPPDTDPLAWYDDTHLVVQRFDPTRTRERLAVVALDGHVTRVLTPWEPASLRAEFHAYRRG